MSSSVNRVARRNAAIRHNEVKILLKFEVEILSYCLVIARAMKDKLDGMMELAAFALPDAGAIFPGNTGRNREPLTTGSSSSLRSVNIMAKETGLNGLPGNWIRKIRCAAR